MKKIKMRQAPELPVRRTNMLQTLWNLTDLSLADVIAWTASYGIAAEKVFFESERDPYGDGEDGPASAWFHRDETDAELEARMSVYQAHLATYQQWETDHAEEIAVVRAAKLEAAKKKSEVAKVKSEAKKLALAQEEERLLVQYEAAAKKLRKKLGK